MIEKHKVVFKELQQVEQMITKQKIIAIDLSKRQALHADPKAIQQTNCTGSLGRTGNTTKFLIIKEAKETILDFPQRTVRVL